MMDLEHWPTGHPATEAILPPTPTLTAIRTQETPVGTGHLTPAPILAGSLRAFPAVTAARSSATHAITMKGALQPDARPSLQPVSPDRTAWQMATLQV